MLRLAVFILILALLHSAVAQFQFFEQMFQQPQQQQPQEPRNVPSDSEWYQRTWDAATCSDYLCPGTLACVSVPHHCPCEWPGVEDKVELGEGSMVCASKGGYKAGEMARKIELARKGLL